MAVCTLPLAVCTLPVAARVAEICGNDRAIAAGADIHLIDDREGEEREHCPALVLAACGCYPGVISVLLDAVRPLPSALCFALCSLPSALYSPLLSVICSLLSALCSLSSHSSVSPLCSLPFVLCSARRRMHPTTLMYACRRGTPEHSQRPFCHVLCSQGVGSRELTWSLRTTSA